MKKYILSMFLIAGVFVLYTCTHEDLSNIEIPGPEIEYGSDEVKMTNGWTFDKSHSSVRWETFYLGSAALLTGRFNNFSIDLNFVENNLSEITIISTVIPSSVNTGEPGRDDGCLQRTFGTDAIDEAVFTSTSAEFDGEGGYIIEGTLDFHGASGPVTMKLDYLGSTYFPEGRNGPYTVAGFSGEFEFLAKSDYGIESGSISDLVTVKVNAQFRKAE